LEEWGEKESALLRMDAATVHKNLKEKSEGVLPFTEMGIEILE
jgi:hypothetical protein